MCSARSIDPAYHADRQLDLLGGIESLESRQLLAGLVIATVNRFGDVVLRGDRYDNSLHVSVANGGQLIVRGTDDTQILWDTDLTRSVELERSRALTIRLAGGNDQLTVTGDPLAPGKLSDSVTIRGGAGDDRIELENLWIGGSALVNSDLGNDSLQLRNLSINGRLSADTGGNQDVLRLDNVESAGDIIARTSWGSDSLEILGSIQSRRSTVQLGNGDDRISLGDARESTTIDSLSTVALGSGNDELLVFSVETFQPVLFEAGSGNDRLVSMGDFAGTHRGFEIVSCHGDFDDPHCGTMLSLSAFDADYNTNLIEQLSLNGGHALIPAGSWPVRPLSIGSGSSIVGLGQGISELRLEIDRPGRYDAQHVIATPIPQNHGDYTTSVQVSNLTINGNYENINWSGVYNDGNAFGLYLRGAENSTFENLEIKNIWTDGIYISTILGHANNTRNSQFENIVIHHAGRQGVSIVGGEHLRLNNFDVYSVGRDGDLHTSPRSAINLEPEANVQRLVRHITISNWSIHHVGQGILVSGGNSSEQAKDIVIQNIECSDLDGPQILAVRDVENLRVSNFSCDGHVTENGGLGVLLRNTTGTVSHLSLRNIRGTNYPLRIDGTSHVNMSYVTVDGADRGVLQVGNEPGQAAHESTVRISSFQFRNIGDADIGLPIVRVNSTGVVSLLHGTITNIGPAPYTVQLTTDVYFANCHFEAAELGLFAPDQNGTALGESNSWNSPVSRKDNP